MRGNAETKQSAQCNSYKNGSQKKSIFYQKFSASRTRG